MQKDNGPFLSAAAIRRILSLHPFTEENRTYLVEEADRREGWERDLEALLGDLSCSAAEAPRWREATATEGAAYALQPGPSA